MDVGPVKRGARSEWLVFGLLVALGLFLRWYRLDLISFRYDTAETLFRTRDILRGYHPLLGIVNSLGFHNPPGLEWLIVPAMLWSPAPELATGWSALLALSGIYPLFAICRSRLAPWSFLVPCAAYAIMPNQVFNDRIIWAQWLMPAIFAWVLWLVVRGARNWRYAAGALALSWLGAAVHLGGLAYLPLVVVVIVFVARRLGWSRAQLGKCLVIGCMPLLLLLPSAWDYVESRGEKPKPKPAHVAKFESLMPPPEPVMPRVMHALSGAFGVFANAPLADDLRQNDPGRLRSARGRAQVCDGILLLLALGGIAVLVWVIVVKREYGGTEWQMPSALLLIWMFFPAILGSALLSRANPTYFTPAIPALLLTTGVLPNILMHRFSRGWVLTAAMALLLAAGYSIFNLAMLRAIDEDKFVQGQYYIPLGEQRAVAKELAGRGVSSMRLQHMSGEWYQRPYDYLLREVYQVPELAPSPGYAVMEDSNLRLKQRARVDFFRKAALYGRGSVGVVFFGNETEARQFVDRYYAIPVDQ